MVSDVSDTLSGVRALSADARALQAALSDTTAALNTTVDPCLLYTSRCV